MYRFAIVDDQEFDKDRISELIDNYITDKNITIEKTYYQDPLKFDFEIIYDAVFLDIDMPTQDGISFAKELLKKQNTKVIFMTNHNEYVFVSLDVRPFHFLRKEDIDTQAPYVLNLLFETLKKENIFLNIHSKDTFKKMNYLDIYYISMDDHICEIYTSTTRYQTWDTLTALYNQLFLYDFIKINKSQLVNLRYVKQIDNHKIILTNNIVLTISLRRKTQVIQDYEKYIMRIL